MVYPDSKEKQIFANTRPTPTMLASLSFPCPDVLFMFCNQFEFDTYSHNLNGEKNGKYFYVTFNCGLKVLSFASILPTQKAK